MTLIEIVVSMLVLAVAALAVTATISLVNSRQMRSAGGGSLDLQALSFARQTLESLKNAVSTEDGHRAPLNASGDTTSTLPAAFRAAPVNGKRTYTVTDVIGNGVEALKQVTVVVTWDD